MPLAAALTMAEFTTAQELLNWHTNDFTCSSNSLPTSKGLPLDFSDSTDTVSGLPSLRRESNLFWYVVTQSRTVLSFKSSSCALLKCLSDALTPFSAAYLASPSTPPKSSRNCPASLQQTRPSLFSSGLLERRTLVLLLKNCSQHR